jgi:hypothetical protein
MNKMLCNNPQLKYDMNIWETSVTFIEHTCWKPAEALSEFKCSKQLVTVCWVSPESEMHSNMLKFNNRLWYRTQYSKLQQILSLSACMQRKYKPPSSQKQVPISPSADNNKHIKTENNNNKFERKIEDDAMQGPKKNLFFCKDLT